MEKEFTIEDFYRKFFKMEMYGPTNSVMLANDEYISVNLPDPYVSISLVLIPCWVSQYIIQRIIDGDLKYVQGYIYRPSNMYQPGHWTNSDFVYNIHYLLPVRDKHENRLFYLWISENELKEHSQKFLSEEDQLKLLLEEL